MTHCDVITMMPQAGRLTDGLLQPVSLSLLARLGRTTLPRAALLHGAAKQLGAGHVTRLG